MQTDFRQIEDKISAEFYNEKRIKWTQELDEVIVKLEALHNVEKKFYEEGTRIIEALKNAYWLYKRQPISEKRKLLNYLLSNITLNDEKVSYDYNSPFSYFVNFDSCRKKYPRCDCLVRSHLTAIPYFANVFYTNAK